MELPQKLDNQSEIAEHYSTWLLEEGAREREL